MSQVAQHRGQILAVHREIQASRRPPPKGSGPEQSALRVGIVPVSTETNSAKARSRDLLYRRLLATLSGKLG